MRNIFIILITILVANSVYGEERGVDKLKDFKKAGELVLVDYYNVFRNISLFQDKQDKQNKEMLSGIIKRFAPDYGGYYAFTGDEKAKNREAIIFFAGVEYLSIVNSVAIGDKGSAGESLKYLAGIFEYFQYPAELVSKMKGLSDKIGEVNAEEIVALLFSISSTQVGQDNDQVAMNAGIGYGTIFLSEGDTTSVEVGKPLLKMAIEDGRLKDNRLVNFIKDVIRIVEEGPMDKKKIRDRFAEFIKEFLGR